MSKLIKSKNRILSGVCGGIAEYFDMDPTLMRIAWVLLTLVNGFTGFLLYVICMLIIPEN